MALTKAVCRICSSDSRNAAAGVQIGIVIGGGNIFRGLGGVAKGFDRVLRSDGNAGDRHQCIGRSFGIAECSVQSRLFTAVRMEPIGELYNNQKAVAALENGEIAILAGGTGNPFFTTDTASSLRAIEIGADVMLKGTRVNGVYTQIRRKTRLPRNSMKFLLMKFTAKFEGDGFRQP